MSMLTLYPYFRRGSWVFDDAKTGLIEEAFVHGADAVLTRLVHEKAIPAAERGFTLRFSDEPFDVADAELTWLRSGSAEAVDGDEIGSPHGGNWYSCTIAGAVMQGWLCDSLLLFFPAPPARIYIKVEPLPAGVDAKCRVRVPGPASPPAVADAEGGNSSE